MNDRLQAKTSLVNACALIQGSDRTGVAEAKNDARAKMSASTLEIGGAVSTYGFLAGNADLQAQASLNPTDLTRLADAEVDDRATAILQRVPAASPGPGQPGAADVGINPGKLDLLETRIETYNLLLGTPRAVRGEKAPPPPTSSRPSTTSTRFAKRASTSWSNNSAAPISSRNTRAPARLTTRTAGAAPSLRLSPPRPRLWPESPVMNLGGFYRLGGHRSFRRSASRPRKIASHQGFSFVPVYGFVSIGFGYILPSPFFRPMLSSPEGQLRQ